MTSIYKHEGALAFYKGTLTPLLGIGACVSVQFGAFHAARRQLESLNSGAPLSYSQYYLAGAAAGISNTVLSSPIEHVRIRLQTQPHGDARIYKGPWDCVKQLCARGGGVTGGLYRGTGVTLVREAQAYGCWFLAFEYLMGLETRGGKKREDIASWKIALYGGLTEKVLWLGSYPFDVVKSKMQTDGLAGKERKYANARLCAAEIWRTEGMRGFWKGLAPTLFRSMPVSAGTFFVVEMVTRAIN